MADDKTPDKPKVIDMFTREPVPSADAPPPPPPNEEAIKAVEELLADLRTGAVGGFVFVARYPNRDSVWSEFISDEAFDESDRFIGRLAVVQHAIVVEAENETIADNGEDE